MSFVIASKIMRLRAQDITATRAVRVKVAPHASAVRLFGSRLDDNARGGNIDLMVDFEQPVENPAELSARLAVHISRAIFNRKVDVLIQAPNLTHTAIHKIGLQEGVLLS